MDTHITLCALSIDYMWLSMLFFNHRNGHGLHRHTVTPPHTWRHIAHGPPDTHTERRAYSLGGTYTADAFRAFTPVNGIQYFVSDTEYQEYITDNDTEHADGAQ